MVLEKKMKMQRQTTDKLRLENLTWSFGSGELKIVALSCFGALQIPWGYFCLEKNYTYISIPYHFPWVLLAPYRDRKQSVLTWIDKDELPWNNIRLPFNLLYNFLHKSTGLKHFWRKGIKVASHGAFIKSIFWYQKNRFSDKEKYISFIFISENNILMSRNQIYDLKKIVLI